MKVIQNRHRPERTKNNAISDLRKSAFGIQGFSVIELRKSSKAQTLMTKVTPMLILPD